MFTWLCFEFIMAIKDFGCVLWQVNCFCELLQSPEMVLLGHEEALTPLLSLRMAQLREVLFLSIYRFWTSWLLLCVILFQSKKPSASFLLCLSACGSVDILATDWWFHSLSLQFTSWSVFEQDTEPQFTPGAASLMCECRGEWILVSRVVMWH